MKTVINEEGKVLYCFSDGMEVTLGEYEIIIDSVCSENFIEAYYDVQTNSFYENAIPEMQIFAKIAQETDKQRKRITDGIEAVASMTAEFNIMVALGYVTQEANISSHNELVSVRSEIMAGSWDKALIQLELCDKEIIGVPLYERFKATINTYIENENNS